MVGGQDDRPVGGDLVDRALEPDPAHRPAEDPATEGQDAEERRQGAVDRLLVGHVPARLGVGSAARRASASRMAFTTASTVSSKRFPSVEMIRASVAGRRGATARVESSSSRRRSASRMAAGLGARRIELAFLGPPPRALLDRGLEIDLEVGVGQDDRPDVAPGHDDPATLGERALALQEREAQLRDRRHGRHGHVDGGAADVVGVVGPVDEHPRQAAGLIRCQLDLVDQAVDGMRIRRRQVAGQREPGHRPIEQARVAEAVTDLERGGGPDAALARRSGTVERDDETLAGRCVHRGRIPATPPRRPVPRRIWRTIRARPDRPSRPAPRPRRGPGPGTAA